MLPTFPLFGYLIPTYDLMMGLCMFFVYGWMVNREPENREHIVGMSACGIIGGLLGSKIIFSILHPYAVFLPNAGNYWYGGLLGLTIALVLYTRIRHLSLGHYGDLAAPACAMGLVILRIGCLLEGCCYGTPTTLPWAIHYPLTHPTHGVGVHPAPVYELLGWLVIAVVLLKLEKSKPFPGFLLILFFMLGGILRFFLDYIHANRLIVLQQGNLSLVQVFSAVFIIVPGLILLYRLGRKPTPAFS